MTAVVGILNKKAVAIAADSAATLHNGKIFNKANKLFMLSKYHPVGISIYNLDSFMAVPWETIIKMYRQKLADTKFDSLVEYQNDFLEYLRVNDFFCTVDFQLLQLNYFFVGINGLFTNIINQRLDVNDPNYTTDFEGELMIEAQNQIDTFTPLPTLPDFVGYTYQNFETFINPRIDEVFNFSFEQKGIVIGDATKNLLKRAYFSQVIAKEYRTSGFTGLVFAGYGERDIFPSTISLQVYIGFDKKLRYFDNGRGGVISHNNSSSICTFAQSDVMYTILTGVAPDLKETYNENFEHLANVYEQVLLQHYPGVDKGDLKFLLKNIDKNNLFSTFRNAMDDVIQKKYVNPLHEAVAALAKEDLAEMAESLIYLTYLQRRITNAEESVGGPVDVALISKGDGFIWMKRKHYFKPELNSHFFTNYFN